MDPKCDSRQRHRRKRWRNLSIKLPAAAHQTKRCANPLCNSYRCKAIRKKRPDPALHPTYIRVIDIFNGNLFVLVFQRNSCFRWKFTLNVPYEKWPHAHTLTQFWSRGKARMATWVSPTDPRIVLRIFQCIQTEFLRLKRKQVIIVKTTGRKSEIQLKTENIFVFSSQSIMATRTLTHISIKI